MLKTQISTTMQGQSMVDNNVVVYLSASIPEDGNSNISQTIQDRELFEKNKKVCLADIADFNERVYELALGGAENEAI